MKMRARTERLGRELLGERQEDPAYWERKLSAAVRTTLRCRSLKLHNLFTSVHGLHKADGLVSKIATLELWHPFSIAKCCLLPPSWMAVGRCFDLERCLAFCVTQGLRFPPLMLFIHYAALGGYFCLCYSKRDAFWDLHVDMHTFPGIASAGTHTLSSV